MIRSTAGCLASDWVQALRRLGRRPGILIATALPAGLGLAAAVVLFRVADASMFRPLRAIPEAQRIVVLQSDGRRPDLQGLRAEAIAAPVFDAVAWVGPPLFSRSQRADLNIHAVGVSDGFFEAMGVKMTYGRPLSRQADEGGGTISIVASWHLFAARFGGDVAAIGQLTDFGGVRVHLTGVLPEGFDYPRETDVYTLLDPRSERRELPSIARLVQGSTPTDAETLVDGLSARPLSDAIRPEGARALLFLLVATSLLVLVSWLQVGSLAAARATAMGSETALRIALGAAPWRLTSLYAMECVIVTGGAVVIATALMPATARVLASYLPPEIAGGRALSLDWRVVAYGSLLAISSTLAMLATFAGAARLGSERGRHGSRRHAPPSLMGAVRRAILGGQVALTTSLLYLTGLAAVSVINILSLSPGFEPVGLLAWTIPVEPGVRSSQEQRRQLLRAAMVDIGQAAVISDVAASTFRPIEAASLDTDLVVVTPKGLATLSVYYNFVTQRYFETLGVRHLSGTIANGDSLTDVTDIVVNEKLASMLGGQGVDLRDPVELPGHFGRGHIRGVVPNVLGRTAAEEPRPVVFLRHPESGSYWLSTGYARTSEPTVAAVAIREAVAKVWGPTAKTTIVEMEAEVYRAGAPWRGRLIVLLIVLGLVLPIGLIGLSSAFLRDVEENRYKAAVQLSLGAPLRIVRWTAVGPTTRSLSTGAVGGVIGGWALAVAISQYFYDVNPWNLLVGFAVISLVLGIAAFLAIGPTRRAIYGSGIAELQRGT